MLELTGERPGRPPAPRLARALAYAYMSARAEAIASRANAFSNAGLCLLPCAHHLSRAVAFMHARAIPSDI
eukprot:11768258-Alexandrium_andersonii.AAC.1